jgi:hypothetical protein
VSTPPEEREQWEKTTMTTMESIRSLDEECTKLYEESTQVWTQLLEDAELQAIEQRLQLCIGEGAEVQRNNKHSANNRMNGCNS